jgi:WD40 repeat protein
VVMLSLCAVSLCFWIAVIGLSRPLSDRKVSNIALSSTGRWLAGGTADGNITVWDHTRAMAPRQLAFPHGSLNDLQFSPDEHVLAIASGDLGIYAPAESAAPRLLRSDGRNYGSVRFSRDAQTLLVVTGAGVIETIDALSGALRLEVCCSSIYGEVTFTPNGEAIVNAGHWPSLWDAHSGQLLGRLTKNKEFYTFRSIAFDASRGAVLMGSQDGRVYAWDLRKIGETRAGPVPDRYHYGPRPGQFAAPQSFSAQWWNSYVVDPRFHGMEEVVSSNLTRSTNHLASILPGPSDHFGATSFLARLATP